MRATIESLAFGAKLVFLMEAGRPPGWMGETPVLHQLSLRSEAPQLGTISAHPPGPGVRGYVIRVLLPWELCVQVEIQLKHVDSRLSEQA
jgi:hypothetical protein